MPFREDIDLSDIADQYEVFGGKRIEEKVTRWGEGETPAYTWQPAPRPGEGEDPAKVGHGPLRCSTSRVVAPGRPAFAWDTNGYYRALGVPWPYVHATRGDLRRGYFEADGSGSIRLTYYLKQLLDPEVRAAYDAQPLGKEFHDLYVEDRLREEAITKAHTRTRAGLFTTPEEMLDAMGYRLVQDQGRSAEPDGPGSGVSIDTNLLNRFDESQHPTIVGTTFCYAFYLWKCTRWDYTRLFQWQAALVSELDSRGITATLAVGLFGKQPHRFLVVETTEGWILFLNHERQVTPDLVSAAADALSQHLSARVPRAHPTEITEKAG